MEVQVEFPKYDSYKNSGVPWLGDIPAHWSLKKNKFIFEEKKDIVGGKANEYKLLSLTLDGVIPRDMENPKGKFPAEFNTYKQVTKDDLIFCLFDIEETPRCIGQAKEDGMITGAYTLMQCSTDVSSRYLYYYYLGLDYDKRLSPLYTGLRKVIQRNTFMGIKTPIPPKDVAVRIADFLDHKTAEIDAAITKKKELIQLLNEQKTILINRAVNKGLNPNVKMKDSGVAWIGEIPEHWELGILKHRINLLPGFAFKSSQYSGCKNDIRLLRGVNISPGQTRWDETVYWPVEKSESLQAYMLLEDDLVFGMDRPWIKSGIRVAKIKNTDLPCLLLQRVARLRSKTGLRQGYLELLLKSRNFEGYFAPMLTGISVPHISPDQIKKFIAGFPNEKEQQEIEVFCEDVTVLTAELISKEQDAILKLGEFKQILITQTTTGKIKV